MSTFFVNNGLLFQQSTIIYKYPEFTAIGQVIAQIATCHYIQVNQVFYFTVSEIALSLQTLTTYSVISDICIRMEELFGVTHYHDRLDCSYYKNSTYV